MCKSFGKTVACPRLGARFLCFACNCQLTLPIADKFAVVAPLPNTAGRKGAWLASGGALEAGHLAAVALYHVTLLELPDLM